MRNKLLPKSSSRNWLKLVAVVGMVGATLGYMPLAQALQNLSTHISTPTDNSIKRSNFSKLTEVNMPTFESFGVSSNLIDIQATGNTSSRAHVNSNGSAESVSVTVNGKQVQVNSGQDGKVHRTKTNIDGTAVDISVQSSGSASNSSSLNVTINSQTETEVGKE